MSNIKVGIKFRPLKESEARARQWLVKGNQISSKNSKHKFSFSNVFGESSTNHDVFALCSPIIRNSLNGYNGTILTYGQTGSGKSYTMMGDNGTKGLIEMAIDDIFDAIDELSDKSFSLRVGFIEIYNEKIYDLLGKMRNEIKIFEYQGQLETRQSEFIVKSKEEIMRFMKIGNKNKHIASTMLNEFSSRSHTIFSISIDSTDEMGETKSSKLIFGDLAGSEKPDATKKSFSEGLHINKSLLALGKIIRELSKPNCNMKNVRFRESLLTRVLASSLGGNSYTTIICTASLLSLDETFNTMCFAQNAEKTKCKPTSNSISDSTREVSILKDKVQKLQKELDLERSRVLENSIININTTYQVTGNTVRRTESLKRKFNVGSQESLIEHPQKIFIQTDMSAIEEDKEIIEDLKRQISACKNENQKLKTELHECNQNLANETLMKESLKQDLKEESHKGWKIKEKCKILRNKLVKKKEKISSIMTKSTISNDTRDSGLDKSCENNLKSQYESDMTHKNLIIFGLEKELEKLQKELSQRKSTKLVSIGVNTDQDSREVERLQQKNYNLQHMIHELNKKILDSNSKNQVLQANLVEINSQATEIVRERDEFRKINNSMKINFQESLQNTRKQFQSIYEQKQQQAADFQQKIAEMKNEELRTHFKLQEHYEKQFNVLKATNEALNGKIGMLEEELKAKNESLMERSRIVDERMKHHENDKIKFIKAKFDMKLAKTVKFFESLLEQKDNELNAIKKLTSQQNSRNLIDKLVAVNLK